MLASFLFGIIFAAVTFGWLINKKTIAVKLIRTLNAWHSLKPSKNESIQVNALQGAEGLSDVVQSLKQMGADKDAAMLLASRAAVSMPGASSDEILMAAIRMQGQSQGLAARGKGVN